MNLDKIHSKNDLIFLISNLINNQLTIQNADETLISLRDKVIELFLKEGDIPPSFFVKIYFLFKDAKIDKSEFIDEQIALLEKYYTQCGLNEKYLINNLLFILDILNSNAFEGLKNYIKRGLTFKIFNNLDNNELKIFYDFILNYPLDEFILINAVKESIQIDYFTNLNEIEKRSVFANALGLVWNNESMYNNKIWLTVFDDLVNLLNYTIQNGLIEEQMYIHFFTYHIYGNNIQTIDEWRIFNEKVEKPASEFYKQFGEKYDLLKPKKEVTGKKIGFLIDRLVLNSPFMVMFSLFKELVKEADVYVYSMGYVDKQSDSQNIINMLESIGIKVLSLQNEFINDGYYYSHLKKALMLRKFIIKDEIDYLVSGFGYDIPNFIFSNRSAPKQIFWSHGNCTSEIANIDLRISHFEQECKEYEWRIFNVPMAEEFLIGTEEEKKQAEILKNSLYQTFGEDTVFIGTIGRLVKIDSDEYLKVIAEIMEQNPNTVYLACGTGNQEKIREKLKKHNINDKRFIFTGQVNPHIFGWVIDVWCDSFPLWQGQSAEEFRMKGGILIRKKVDEKPTYDEFEKVLKQASIEEIYEGKAKIDLKDINLPPKYVKLLNEAISGNKESLVFLILHLGFVSNERYLEIANFFIKHKELRDICKNLDKTLLLESGGYHKADINDFLKILKGEK